MTKLKTSLCALEMNLSREQEISLLGYALDMVMSQEEPTSDEEPDHRQVEEPEIDEKPIDYHENNPEPWSGFILAECEKCKDLRAFNTHTPITEYVCSKCGETTQLKNKTTVYMRCPSCGTYWTYRTNSTDAAVQAACIDCGTIMEAAWNYDQRCYGRRKGW